MVWLALGSQQEKEELSEFGWMIKELLGCDACLPIQWVGYCSRGNAHHNATMDKLHSAPPATQYFDFSVVMMQLNTMVVSYFCRFLSFRQNAVFIRFIIINIELLGISFWIVGTWFWVWSMHSDLGAEFKHTSTMRLKSSSLHGIDARHIASVRNPPMCRIHRPTSIHQCDYGALMCIEDMDWGNWLFSIEHEPSESLCWPV